MPYSKSKKTIQRVEIILQQILDSPTTIIEFPSSNPLKLRHIIYDAIHASKYYPEYHKFKDLLDKVKFKVNEEETCLIVETKDVIIETKTEVLASIKVPGLKTDLQIIGAALTAKVPVLVFPLEEDLSILSMLRIRNWGETQGYTLIKKEKEIILTKDENAKDLAWIPPTT